MPGEVRNKAVLKDAIQDYMQRGDLSNQFDRWIDMTRYRFGQQLRAFSNQVTTILSPVVAGDAYYNLPPNFVEMRAVYVLDSDGKRTGMVRPYTSSQLERFPVDGSNVLGYVFTGSGDGTTQTIAGVPDSSGVSADSPTPYSQLQLITGTGEDLEIVYWSIPAPLNADTDSNETLLQWPYLYVYACLIEGHTYVLDFDARDSMKEIYDTELMTANKSSRKALLAGGSAVATPAPAFRSGPVRAM